MTTDDHFFHPTELASLFEESQTRAFGGQPLRLTGTGIWMPTPFDVVRAAGRALARLDRDLDAGVSLGERVLDAGMGDGRLVASLVAEIPGITVLGIESHPELAALARQNLKRAAESGLNGSWCVCQGDYLDVETYRKLGVELELIDTVLNYPDGNEGFLGDLLSRRGKRGALLAFLTPDHSLRIESLVLVTDVPLERDAGAPEWRLSIFRVSE